MKKIKVPLFTPNDESLDEMERIFASQPEYIINCCNWPKEYPYTPEVTFKIFHDSKNLYIKFNVTEKDIHAIINEDFGKVWTDPCVEFFVSPGCNSDYYNIECTCIGKLLIAWHPANAPKENLSIEVLNNVRRHSSLGKECFPMRKGNTSWSIIEVIPATTLCHSNIDSWSNKKMLANFYKCGDNLPTPHFISWNAIDWPEPSFHRPEFFGELEFE